MNTIQISSNILQWVAEQRGLSISELVDLLGGASSKHEAQMSGKFTIKQVETLAQKTNIPFGYFFLDTPPQLPYSNIPDLRQLPDVVPLSIDFFDTLNDILRKQQWYLDYLKEHGANELNFVGKFKIDSSTPIEDIASDIRNTLNLTIQEQKERKDFRDFFNLLTEKAENIGILIFKNGIVKNNAHRSLSVDEFRGFAIADSYTPIIFINGKDYEAAWIFTLAHELAHIWLGESGVSDIPDKPIPIKHKLEQYCNKIAAELLTPKKLFLNAWKKHPEPKIEALSKEFRVSQRMIAKRAYDLHKISWNDYLHIIKSSKKPKKNKARGGNPYLVYPLRNSKRITNAIVNTAMSGDMMLREAASLLNVKPDTVMEMGRRRTN